MLKPRLVFSQTNLNDIFLSAKWLVSDKSLLPSLIQSLSKSNIKFDLGKLSKKVVKRDIEFDYDGRDSYSRLENRNRTFAIRSDNITERYYNLNEVLILIHLILDYMKLFLKHYS